MAITAEQQTEILKVVAGLFNASPGGIYLTDLANMAESGMSTEQIADTLAAHPLFTNNIMAGKVTTESQVGVLMNNFGVSADSDPASAGSQAQAYFTSQIDAGVGFGKIVFDAVTFLNNTTDPAFTTAANLLKNKALIAEIYSQSNTSVDLSVLQNTFNNVPSESELTRQQAQNFVDALPRTPLVLTDTIDALTGTSNNDNFIGTDTTFNTGDSLNGGAGTADTLDLTLTAANAAFVTMNSVEVVKIRALAVETATAAEWEGVTQVWSNNSTENLTVSDVGALAAVGVNRGDGANDFTVAFDASVVEGEEDAISVNLTDADAGTVTVDGVETFNVLSSGTSENELVALAGDAVTAVNIEGSQELIIATALANTITAIDGSTATGALEFEVSTALAASTDELSVKLGTGDDTLTTGTILGAVHADATLALDGGEGVDILAVDAQIDADVDVNAEITNFETLQIDADVAYDVNNYNWIQAINLNADITAGKVIDNIAADVVTNILVDVTNVELSHKNAGKVGTQTIAVGIGGEAAVTAGTLTIDGVEAISINSSGEAANTITAMGNDALRTLTITGDQDLTVTALENIQDSLVASDFTGALTIDLSAQANALDISIGTGGSSITIDAEGDDAHQITLGEGAVDTIAFLSPNDGAPADSVSNRTTITGFTGDTGGDVLDLSDGAGVLVSDTEAEEIQAAVDLLDPATDDITAALDAAIGAFTGAANDVYFFEFDGSTYVVYEEGTNAATFDPALDYVIELVGTDLGLTTDNIVL